MTANHKDCIMVLTNKLTNHTINFYNTLQQATAGFCDVFLLYHASPNADLPTNETLKIEPFTDDILSTLEYKPFTKKLLPGSAHFPLLYFFRKKPDYRHYWLIEDDVAFNGNWKDLFTAIGDGPDYDLITSHIRRPKDMPRWFWWKRFRFPENEFNKEKLLSSFSPIYRISNRALKYLEHLLRGDYCGHQELLFPSLLNNGGFSIADLGTTKNHFIPSLAFCTLQTMRWRPVFLFVGKQKNKLYHPVKETITFFHVFDYVKRTALNIKKYRIK